MHIRGVPPSLQYVNDFIHVELVKKGMQLYMYSGIKQNRGHII